VKWNGEALKAFARGLENGDLAECEKAWVAMADDKARWFPYGHAAEFLEDTRSLVISKTGRAFLPKGNPFFKKIDSNDLSFAQAAGRDLKAALDQLF
jgi:hypothetical protein